MALLWLQQKYIPLSLLRKAVPRVSCPEIRKRLLIERRDCFREIVLGRSQFLERCRNGFIQTVSYSMHRVYAYSLRKEKSSKFPSIQPKSRNTDWKYVHEHTHTGWWNHKSLRYHFLNSVLLVAKLRFGEIKAQRALWWGGNRSRNVANPIEWPLNFYVSSASTVDTTKWKASRETEFTSIIIFTAFEMKINAIS